MPMGVGIYNHFMLRKQLRDILEDPRCTPAERLECVRKIEQYKKEAGEKQKNKPSVKKKQIRSMNQLNKNTGALSSLLEKVEHVQ